MDRLLFVIARAMETSCLSNHELKSDGHLGSFAAAILYLRF